MLIARRFFFHWLKVSLIDSYLRQSRSFHRRFFDLSFGCCPKCYCSWPSSPWSTLAIANSLWERVVAVYDTFFGDHVTLAVDLRSWGGGVLRNGQFARPSTLQVDFWPELVFLRVRGYLKLVLLQDGGGARVLSGFRDLLLPLAVVLCLRLWHGLRQDSSLLLIGWLLC